MTSILFISGFMTCWYICMFSLWVPPFIFIDSSLPSLLEAKSRPKFPAAQHTDTTIIEHPVRPHPLIIVFDTITMPIELLSRVLTGLITMLTGSVDHILKF